MEKTRLIKQVTSLVLLLGGLFPLGCDRQVSVSGIAPDAGVSPSLDAGKTNLLDGIDQLHPDAALPGNSDTGIPPMSDALAAGQDASPPRSDGATLLPDATLPGGPDAIVVVGQDAGILPPQDTGVTPVDGSIVAPPDASLPKDAASVPPITGVQVLLDGLNAITLPAVGSDRVSMLQYTATGTAMTVHVTWNRVIGRWYESTNARHIYTAASGTRHVALLYSTDYPIRENGGAAELSSTPASYKEFLSANNTGFAWVDYPNGATGGTGGTGGAGGTGGGGRGPTTSTSLGPIVFQTWQGTRTTLTDSARYRCRIDLSSTRIVYVEYANTATGTPGQIVAQPLAGGVSTVIAPSARHQDRPAIDGDWVVWEEYLNDTDTVIRAKNLSTNELRDLSATVGFRTNPDIRGTKVAWEDQRGGEGDIYLYDLAGPGPERVAVSGPGYSTGVRLTDDGLVWIESNGNNIGLLMARWTP